MRVFADSGHGPPPGGRARVLWIGLRRRYLRPAAGRTGSGYLPSGEFCFITSSLKRSSGECTPNDRVQGEHRARACSHGRPASGWSGRRRRGKLSTPATRRRTGCAFPAASPGSASRRSTAVSCVERASSSWHRGIHPTAKECTARPTMRERFYHLISRSTMIGPPLRSASTTPPTRWRCCATRSPARNRSTTRCSGWQRPRRRRSPTPTR